VSGQTTKLAIRAINTSTVAASAVTSCLRVPANLVITRAAGGTRAKGTVCFTIGDLAANPLGHCIRSPAAVTLRRGGDPEASRGAAGTLLTLSRAPAPTPSPAAGRSSG
jgi:hypothetical protein